MEINNMKPMLAGKFVEKKVANKLPLFAQPKYDGIRMMVRDGTAFTRAIKEIRSKQIQDWTWKHRDILEGIDGEVICGEPTAPDCYRRTSSSVMSYYKPDEFKFYVFDKWDNTGPYIHRKNTIAKIADSAIYEIVITPSVFIQTMEQLQEYEQDMISEGHEGVILRSPWALYKEGRGSPIQCELIKMKRFIDTEAVITDFHELMHNNNEATIDNLGRTERSSHKEGLIPMNTLGAVEAVGYWEDGTSYNVRIGTGFDEVQRQEVWDRRHTHIGKIVKFKYFGSGMKESPRFPVFIGFRDESDI